MFVAGLVPILTFALGTWQVERLKWKVNLIDELKEKLQREPMPLPRKINLDTLPEFTYRKVLLRGKWDHSHTIFLGPRVNGDIKGYHLIVPLVRPDGSTVLVDRGFVSKEHVDITSSLRIGDANEEVEVLGMLRTGQVRNIFTPDNHPEKGEWYWADVNSIAEYAGGEKAGVQPVFVEEIFEGHAGDVASRIARGIPVGRSPAVDIRNSHVSYIITW
ncbi:hypothetical protein PHLCEN_2v3841 [Hermanssonia centrifuga]|uniref:SURF1-like protein n=1 Tax=Hermanssonia centrifuga TaxID=98765 RepID=A0A2R6QBE7_9APHY|nr:hypothetical protein PHLCEN_2v3841 [Hermanssonia centrifuga]